MFRTDNTEPAYAVLENFFDPYILFTRAAEDLTSFFNSNGQEKSPIEFWSHIETIPKLD